MTTSELAVGAEVAGYRVEALIGRGGMAVVYRAEDLRLGRKVALKLLAPDLSSHGQFRQRFVRESRLAASLDHPNIIPIFEAGESDGVLYIVMRLVVGSDLKEIIAQAGALDPRRTLALFTQVGDALDAAHLLGLVHRDVKPGNILVASTREGTDHVYLTDFGLTKRRSSLSGDLTSTGHFLGTTDYVAPEQISGKSVEPRTDLYALGCVLYECLTGQVPFHREDDAALLWAHLIEPPPPVTASRPDLPREVDAVVARAMAKAPEERYASCLEFVLDLQDALQLPPPPRGPRPRARSQALADGSPELGPEGGGTPPDATNGAGPASPLGLLPRRSEEPEDDDHGERSAARDGEGQSETDDEFPPDVAEADAPPRRRSVLPLVLVLLVAIAAAAGGFFFWSQSQEKTTTFAKDGIVLISFRYPSAWRVQEEGVTAVFSPAADKLFPLFSRRDWGTTRLALQANSSTTTGLFTRYTTTPLDTGTAGGLQDAVKTALPDNVTSLSSASPVTVGQQRLPAQDLEGFLVDPASPATRLRFVIYISEGQQPGIGSILITFFAPPKIFDSQRPVFDRLLKTVQF